LLLGIAAIVLACAGCDQMAQQPSVQTYELPQLHPPKGAVAVDAQPPLPPQDSTSKRPNPLPSTPQTVADGKLAYRRYCWPCHGPNLDGNATVGPSFPRGSQNLMLGDVINQPDGELFWKITAGSGMHPRLGSTITANECWQIIAYMRAVQKGQKP
jgi:mono/diheme cytochrome c family protein